jgi:hypothetical protein
MKWPSEKGSIALLRFVLGLTVFAGSTGIVAAFWPEYLRPDRSSQALIAFAVLQACMTGIWAMNLRFDRSSLVSLALLMVAGFATGQLYSNLPVVLGVIIGNITLVNLLAWRMPYPDEPRAERHRTAQP